ncbi:MAG: 3-phosphoshikimate 1-carboxyvinyltransferase [Armatimonadota bacterium]|nr:3-phosphoshikimate 1-carboxyvinyltransferase [Armatimonadota bacterium]MDR5702003.1 3-phosphoshikimate 1-carboxyvinyltransferase [Armatimonadota bacterium]
MDLVVTPAPRLRGRIFPPGDKSISHRAVMLSAIAEGETVVEGFLWAADCIQTVRCMRRLGVPIEEEAHRLVVHGVGLGGLREAEDVLDAGNSGTTMRLLCGILAGQPFYTVMTGDASLRRRPMDRVVVPLREMGARIEGRMGGKYAPLSIHGGNLRGIDYSLPVPSAQVKSAVLLAGLYAEGSTTIRESIPSRDHTERMLTVFGAEVSRGTQWVTVKPPERLYGTKIQVPGDFSSAAFFIVAAAAHPRAEVVIQNVGLNPTRTGALEVLREMGAQVEVIPQGEVGGEPVGELFVRGGPLRGVRIEGDRIPRLIDEIPILCIAAAVAEGETVIEGAGELRVKESDRLAAIAIGLRALGITVEELPEGLVIRGGRFRGGRVHSFGDHRIAMAFAIAGLLSEEPVMIEETDCIVISFPGFKEALQQLILS